MDLRDSRQGLSSVMTLDILLRVIIQFITTDKAKSWGRREGIGVMKDEEQNKFGEIDAPHTLGGVGRYYTDVIHT